MHLFIPCTPVGKQRPRVVNGHAFTPKKTKDCEAAIRTAFLTAATAERIEAPRAVEVSVTVYLPIPKSWPKKNRSLAAFGDLHHTSRPDLDNLVKTVLDALNGIAWDDDAQVCRMTATKRYETGIGPGFDVEITPYLEL